MAVIQKNLSVGIGATSDNVLAGSTFEFPRTNVLVQIGALASVAGVFLTILSGTDIILEESEMAVGTTFPILPDQFYYTDVASAGERLVVRVRNPTVAAIDTRVIVIITPV